MSANQRGPEHGDDAALAALFAIDPAAVKIGKEIGKGAFSVVYLGEYNKKRVAVKCQPKDEQGNIPPFVLKEVEILQKLRHANILEFVGAADSRKTRQVLILSEHSNHGDLDLLLKNTRAQKTPHMGWARLAEMALDIARGVAFLHASGMIHRDIKSSNILLDDAWRAKLCDFGFATETKWWYEQRQHHQEGGDSASPEAPRRKSYCGTDAYMAPEMFLDEDYNENVDVFSFGVVLMEMLCCRQANKDGFLMRLPQHKFQILTDEFRDALPLSCPPSLARLAEKCVSFEPSERPTIADAVAALEEILASKELTDAAAGGAIELRPFTPTAQQQDVAESEPQLDDDDESSDDDDDEDDEDDRDDSDDRDNDSGADTMEIDEEEETGEAAPVLPPPYHTGSMLKRNRRGNRGWSEKLFILDRDHLKSTDKLAEQQQAEQAQKRKTHARRLSQPAAPPTVSSLYLKDCRIWKTMEMPELNFNIVDGRWKIKRELRALNLDDLDRWMALINQAIDFANEQAALKANGSARQPSTLQMLFGRGGKSANNGDSRHSHSSSEGSRERRGSRGARNKFTEERRPETPGSGKQRHHDDVEDTFEDHNDEVYQWLKQLELQRYTAIFHAKGFASVDFIRETGIEKDDLNFLGIKDTAARKALIRAARTLRGDDE